MYSTVFVASSNTDHSIIIPLTVSMRTAFCTRRTLFAMISRPSYWTNTRRNAGTHDAFSIFGACFSCTRDWSIARWACISNRTNTWFWSIIGIENTYTIVTVAITYQSTTRGTTVTSITGTVLCTIRGENASTSASAIQCAVFGLARRSGVSFKLI